MSIVASVFLLLALIVPGHVMPPVPWTVVFAVIWFILHVLDKTGVMHLP